MKRPQNNKSNLQKNRNYSHRNPIIHLDRPWPMCRHSSIYVNRSAILRMAKRFFIQIQQNTEGVEIWIWSSCFLGTQRAVPLEHTEHQIQAWCSFCSTRSSEQLQCSIMESESTYGSSARSTYSRADHSVSNYICYTGAHASSSCFP